ncbi:MAG: alanine racemase [Pyrinomonadaceae bacterium]|nr:alanine racemase [Pyrinomonadaceae bacterium]
MLVSELETPAVVVDLDVMERNLSRMTEYCRRQGIALRPHTKSHKIPDLARRQIESGAIGITVAKIGEAEVMLDSGITDILIAYPLVGRGKATRVAELAERADITVSLDSLEAARTISEQVTARNVKVGILAELDVGFGRCGVANEKELLMLAEQISVLPGLEFRGLMFFPGQFVVGPTERSALLGDVNDLLGRTQEAFERAGWPLATVSGGSTPTAYDAHKFLGVNEVRPGMYIFNDRNMAGIGVAGVEDCALSVIVTVVSNSVAGRVIVDGGSKTFSSDRYLAGDRCGFGLVKEDPDAELETLSEEHGHLNIRDSMHRYRIGERLSVIPNHVCSTVNMHDEIYGVRGERVETVWSVAGRGKVR